MAQVKRSSGTFPAMLRAVLFLLATTPVPGVLTAEPAPPQQAPPAPRVQSPPVAGTPAPTHLNFNRSCEQPPSVVGANATGVSTPPQTRADRPLQPPTYPPVSRRLNEQGSAIMLLYVNEKGEVVQARIHESTGHARLDLAALQVTDQWRFAPATRDGKPTCAWGKYALTFKLEEPVPAAGDELEELLFEKFLAPASPDRRAVLGQFRCARIALKRALDKGMAARGLPDTGTLPQGFRNAMPEMLRQIKPHCECAGAQFIKGDAHPSSEEAMAISPTLVSSGKCPGPAMPSW